MSIRLSKVGNIPEAKPYSVSNSIAFQADPPAFILKTGTPLFWPFNASNLYDEHFRAYDNGMLGDSGSTVNYCGQGVGTLRRTTRDYFLAGFNLTSLFDPERDTPALVGISSQIEVVTLSSEKLPQIIPMFLFSDQSGNAQLIIRGLNIVTPSNIARFTSGVSRSMLTVENSFEVSRVAQDRVCNVYFGWFVGRSVPNINESDYVIKDLNIAVSASSLIGNRQVFDPVMV